MGSPVFWIGYAVLAFITGVAGRHRRIGFTGFFILALLMTPPLILLILILTRPKPPVVDDDEPVKR
jgi:hypothetical protein